MEVLTGYLYRGLVLALGVQEVGDDEPREVQHSLPRHHRALSASKLLCNE